MPYADHINILSRSLLSAKETYRLYKMLGDTDN